MTDAEKDQIIDASNIVDVVGEFVGLRQNGREYKGLCPFHDDNKPSMTVTAAKGRGLYKCFSCGAGGDVVSFLQEYNGWEFMEAMTWLADRAGIQITNRREAKGSKAPVQREAQPKKVEEVPLMTAQEVMEVYQRYKKAALDPKEWMDGLGVEVRAMELIEAVVAPYQPSPDRIVLVVPMRDEEGMLCSLRFRDFENKRRWSLDEKARIGGERKQVKATRSGLMSHGEVYDPDLCLDGMVTVAVEGETDLMGGLSLLLREKGDDPLEWPARFVGLPGVSSCHDMLSGLRHTRVTMTFMDGDEAGLRAVFDHRRKRRVDGVMKPDLERPMEPGLLSKLNKAGTQGRAAFPPTVEGKKYDLRDMSRDGWTWSRFYGHCLKTGTADRAGRRRRWERN